MPVADPALVAPPVRPKMPTPADDARARHVSARYAILEEDHEDIVGEWMDQHMDPELRSAWGPPDLSANPLAEICTGLSTPGHYGRTPVVHHADASAQGLIGPDGALAASGHWTRQQRVQYYAYGLGDMLIRLDVPARLGRLTSRLALPHNVYAEWDDDQPDQAIRLWELRLRWLDALERWAYTWDQWDLGLKRGSTVVRPPSFRVVEANADGTLGNDLSNVFIVGPNGAYGALEGDAYPYRYSDGEPFLPYGHYRAADTGRGWNYLLRRGVHRGTLNAAMYYTFAGHTALAASGSFVVAWGLNPMSSSVQRDKDAPNGLAPVRSMKVTPGAMAYHVPSGEAGVQPNVVEVGPGGNLDSVAAFCREYEIKQAMRFGLNGNDVTRQHANPTSGASLAISSRQKRETQQQTEEVFRRSDLEVVRKAAALLRLAGVATYPEDGYSITYHAIPKDPGEEQADREQIDWEVKNDFLDPVGGYQRLHAGVNAEDAERAIIDNRLRKLQLEQKFAAAAAAAGVTIPADDGATQAFNDLSLALERLTRAGDLDGVNAIRRAIAAQLRVEYPGDLEELGTPGAPPTTTPDPATPAPGA